MNKKNLLFIFLILIIGIAFIYRIAPYKFKTVLIKAKQNAMDVVKPTEETSPNNTSQVIYKSQSPSEKLHLRSVEPDTPLGRIISDQGLTPDENINLYVNVKDRTMYVNYKDTTLKKYRISYGSRTDEGNKEKEGDFKTPRGTFYVCTKDVYSPPKGYLGSRWMLLSYPDPGAAKRGLQSGLIEQWIYNEIDQAYSNKSIPPQNTILGSAIGIHGGAKPNLQKDWTAGCVGMYDQDVEEIFEVVKVGTQVVIE